MGNSDLESAGLLSSFPRSWVIVFAVIVARLLVSVHNHERICFDTRQYLLLGPADGRSTADAVTTLPLSAWTLGSVAQCFCKDKEEILAVVQAPLVTS